MKVISAHCPHCRSRATARTSREMSATMREITYVCKNLECGHVWVAVQEAVRTLSPSAIPNLEIKLPMSPHIDPQKLQLSLALS